MFGFVISKHFVTNKNCFINIILVLHLFSASSLVRMFWSSLPVEIIVLKLKPRLKVRYNKGTPRAVLVRRQPINRRGDVPAAVKLDFKGR